MSYGYIAETTHGDVPFATPVHHEEHDSGLQGWWEDFKGYAHEAANVFRQTLNLTQQVADTTFKIIAIHEHVQGQRGKKVADLK